MERWWLVAVREIDEDPDPCLAVSLQRYPSDNLAEVENRIVSNASTGNLSRNAPFPANTADRLLYTNL